MNTNFIRSLFFLFIFMLAVYGVIYVVARYRPARTSEYSKNLCRQYNNELSVICTNANGTKKLYILWGGK